MKISKKILPLLAIAMLLLGSCGIFNGGGNCDCPKFGSNTEQNDDADTETASASSLE
ncbi:MAG: hypothetical protein WAT43_15020 [Chitinophagales bacterium]|nr:hypothetical protein [Bacteroidota bacterium]